MDTFTLSASIAVCRAQADVFGGRSDGKSGLASVEFTLFQVLTGARDDRVGLIMSAIDCNAHVST